MQVQKLMRDNFLTYASYVIRDRAIPHIHDGLKPVQRRLLHTLFEMEDGRFHKVSNVVGQCMRYHPHGEASIYEALVNLANKGLFIDTQGNFGNIFTGDGASAPRYIECRLRPLARELLYLPEITQYEDSYDGRSREPLSFPAKLPLVLVLGVEGIAVGMSTMILPHNYREVVRAMKASLDNKPFTLYPDFPTGGLIDVTDYDNGRGKIRSRARFDISNEKQIIIRELPYGKTTSGIIASIQAAVRKRKVNITEIHDYTTDAVEVMLRLGRGAKVSEVMSALYAFTDCETTLHLHPLVIKDDKPQTIPVSEIIEYHSQRLCDILHQQLSIELSHCIQELRSRTLERIFIEEKLYRRLEEAKQNLFQVVRASFAPFQKEIGDAISDKELDKLLQIPIRRISRYDREKEERAMAKVRARRGEITAILGDIVGYAQGYLDSLLTVAGSDRKSSIAAFEKLVAKEVAARNLSVFYDDQRGFLGTRVASGRKILTASEFDRLLVVREDGQFSVIPLPERVYVGKNMQFCALAEKAALAGHIFTVVYQDAQQQSYIKRCQIQQFIIGREYSLVPEGGRLQLLTMEEKGRLRMRFAPGAKTRKKGIVVALTDYRIQGYRVRGKRVHLLPISQVELLLK